MNCLPKIVCGFLLGSSLLGMRAQPFIQPEVLHYFPTRAYPGGPLPAPDGALYGITEFGGIRGIGDIFRITTNGSYSSIADFSSCPECGGRKGSFVIANSGTIYGSRVIPVPNSSYGTVYTVTTNGVMSAVTTFYGTNGGTPASLAIGPDGLLYGITHLPGPDIYGTVFRMTTNGDFTTIRSLYASNTVFGISTLGSDGNFYGTGYSSYSGANALYRMNTNGETTNLGTFDPTNHQPAGVMQGPDGNFYGTIRRGGSDNGSVFMLTTDGLFTSLASFNGTLGNDPVTGLVWAGDGSLYGATSFGGAVPDGGTVYRVTTNGTLSFIAEFSGTNDAEPASLSLGRDGNLYGTTISENPGSSVLFRINIASVPPVIQSSSATNGQFTLTWSALYGRTYQPQYCTDMTVANWTNLGASVLATNSKMTTTDLAIQSSQKFYRVALLPAP